MPNSLKDIITGFREKKQLPVLFMTIVGMAAFLFGFGYLMQYSLVNYFINNRIDRLLSVGLGFLASALFFVVSYLLKDKEKYKLFSEALMGLSIALNYLLIYFLSGIRISYLGIPATIVGVVFVLANSALAVYLSVKHESKLLAFLCLIGGVYSPYYLNTRGGSPFYFFFIYFIIASSIYISGKIGWKMLILLTFLTVFSNLEFYVLDTTNSWFSNPSYLFFFFTYAAVFYYTSIFNGKSLKPGVKIVDIIILSANTVLLLFNLFYFYLPEESYTALGIIYLLTSLPFVWMFIVYHKLQNRNMQLLAILIISLFVLLAVYFLSGRLLRCFIWSVEALVLVYLGFIFSFSWIRRIGYILLSITVAGIITSFPMIIYNWGNTLYTTGFYNLLWFGAIVICMMVLTAYYSSQTLRFEKGIAKWLDEIFSLWFASTLFLFIAYYSMQWFAFLSLIPAFLLLYRGLKADLFFSKALGYIIYLIVLFNSLYWAITDIPADWDNFFGSGGFFNLIISGVLFVSLKYWYIIVDSIEFSKSCILIKSIPVYGYVSNTKTLQNKNIGIIRMFDMFFSIWFVVFFMLVMLHIAPDWLASLSLIPAFILIYSGYVANKPFDRGLGYFVYFGFLIYICILAAIRIVQYWNPETYMNIFPYLMQVGLFILALLIIPRLISETKYIFGLKGIKRQSVKITKQFYPFTTAFYDIVAIFYSVSNLMFGRKEIENSDTKSIKQPKDVLWNFFFIWICVTYFIASFFWLKSYSLNLLIIPAYILMIIGARKKLLGTEVAGISMMAIMFAGAVVLVVLSGALSFSKQTLQTKLLIIELFLSLWALKSAYQYFAPANKRTLLTNFLRNTFYFLLPVAAFYLSVRKLYNYNEYFLWVIVAMSFILCETIKTKALFGEFYAWILLSTLIVFRDFEYAGIFAGLITLCAIVVYKKGIQYRISNLCKNFTFHYRYLVSYTYYYFGAFLFCTSRYLFPNDYISPFFIVAVYLFVLVYFRYQLFPIRATYRFAYRVAFYLMSTGQLLLLTGISVIDWHRLNYDTKLFAFVLMPVSLVCLTVLLYQRNRIYQLEAYSRWYTFDMYWLHACYSSGYIFLLTYWGYDLSRPVTTVMFFVHSAFLFLSSLRPSHKFLSSLAILLFIFACLKLFIKDFEGLNMIQRVLILLPLGAIFLGAAFLYAKRKDKLEKKNNIETE